MRRARRASASSAPTTPRTAPSHPRRPSLPGRRASSPRPIYRARSRSRPATCSATSGPAARGRRCWRRRASSGRRRRTPGRVSAWPSKGRHDVLRGRRGTRVTWVRRGTGRWWRLQASGRDLFLISALDATHALVAPAGLTFRAGQSDAQWLGVVDLAQPAVDPPSVEPQSGGLTCAVPWSRADADTTAYAWLRDGAVLRGASAPAVPPDAARSRPRPHLPGHGEHSWGVGRARRRACPIRSPGRASTPPRPRLTGTPLAGSRLTCSARTSITWLRGGRTVPGLHARTYRVQPADRGLLHRLPHAAGDGTVGHVARRCASRAHRRRREARSSQRSAAAILMLCAAPAAAVDALARREPAQSLSRRSRSPTSRARRACTPSRPRTTGAATTAAPRGRCWRAAPSPAGCELRASPADADLVYTGCGSVSGDGGAHWSRLPTIEGPPADRRRGHSLLDRRAQ